MMWVMSYPSRPRLEPLPQFSGHTRPGARVTDEVRSFVVRAYVEDGRSLREIAELTDRSFGAVRNILQRSGHLRCGVGAMPVTQDPEPGLS